MRTLSIRRSVISRSLGSEVLCVNDDALDRGSDLSDRGFDAFERQFDGSVRQFAGNGWRLSVVSCQLSAILRLDDSASRQPVTTRLSAHPPITRVSACDARLTNPRRRPVVRGDYLSHAPTPGNLQNLGYAGFTRPSSWRIPYWVGIAVAVTCYTRSL